jgi:hypothetical protein
LPADRSLLCVGKMTFGSFVHVRSG